MCCLCSVMAEQEMSSSGNEEQAIDQLAVQIAEKHAEDIGPILEDICEWLNKLIPINITPENFLDVLDTGVILLDLLDIIKSKAVEHKLSSTLPTLKLRCHENAAKESFFARENASQFIQWCRQAGLSEAALFESDGLVLHKQLRNVVLTLLELGRYAAKYGIEPPGLVKLEKQIDHEEKASKPVQDLEELKDVDKEVRVLALKYNVHVKKLKPGKYLVENKMTIFVRIFRHNVMVRVGGGWDHLEKFLKRHSPEKIGKILISTPQGFVHGKIKK